MQETTYNDGRVNREYFTETDLKNRMQRQAENMDGVQSVRFAKIGRNDLCPCGSGRKFKKCCISKMAR
jgi:uncharacterized protein YecA (UPF0149 family)